MALVLWNRLSCGSALVSRNRFVQMIRRNVDAFAAVLKIEGETKSSCGCLSLLMWRKAMSSTIRNSTHMSCKSMGMEQRKSEVHPSINGHGVHSL